MVGCVDVKYEESKNNLDCVHCVRHGRVRNDNVCVSSRRTHLFRLSHSRTVQTTDMDRMFLQEVPTRGIKKTLNKTQLSSLIQGDNSNGNQSILDRTMTVHTRNESNLLLTVPLYVYEDLIWYAVESESVGVCTS